MGELRDWQAEEIIELSMRIAELQADNDGLRKYRSFIQKRNLELETENATLKLRIATAKELAGHKSLDSRRELLAILEGDECNTG